MTGRASVVGTSSSARPPGTTPLGRDVGRMQAFSDGVFAFAATLLVVTLQVPGSYDDLLDALSGFPALALAFAAIVSLWAIHREFFAKYPLGDTWSVALNSVLLFTYVGTGLVAGLSIITAAADVGVGWGLPVWLLLVASPCIELVRSRVVRTHALRTPQP